MGMVLKIIVGIGLGVGALLVAAMGAFEWQYRRRPGNALHLTNGTWELESHTPWHYRLVGEMELVNQTRSLDIMVPELQAKTKLFSQQSLAGVQWHTRVIPAHPDVSARADDYWFAYIVKGAKTTGLKVIVEIQGSPHSALQSAWIWVDYVTYGPQGRIPKTRHVVVPLQFPKVGQALLWRRSEPAEILPIPTHLLTAQDDPVAIVRRYVAPHAQPGDVVTIGETPLAIMQGRFRHPSEIKPGWVARRLCYFFMPLSSLATACGMQALVDIVGSMRVLFAFGGGALARWLFRHRGGFYQLAGEQARLIDDVTGTLPPYDQFIVLGPEQPQQVVARIQQEVGLACAIVDVNDLKAVKVLAASEGLSTEFLTEALRLNPAGNADEQTPIVLLRPKSTAPASVHALVGSASENGLVQK